MSGDTENAEYWPDADVYVADVDATAPATIDDDFDSAWDLVGLLDGEAGFVESREEDVNNVFGWGGIFILETRNNFIMSKTFTALEYNDVTRGLIYPGSEPGEIVVPRPAKKKLAFELVGTDGVKRRLITANHGIVSLDGDRSEVETDITRNPFMVKIVPDATVSPPKLFIEQGPEFGS